MFVEWVKIRASEIFVIKLPKEKEVSVEAAKASDFASPGLQFHTSMKEHVEFAALLIYHTEEMFQRHRHNK